jgi:hypothetical protein
METITMQDLTLNTESNPKRDRRQALAMTAVAMVAVYILWNLSVFDFLLTPLRLFVTYVHEAGHGLMALLTGGKIAGFMVSENGSGLTQTLGGSRALILPAGYLGAAFFGSVLFYIVNRFPRAINNIAIALGAGMVVYTLAYARPDEAKTLFAFTLGIGFGVLLILIGAKAPRLVALLIINILAVSTALEAVLDLWKLLGQISATRGEVQNDAAAFARDITPLIPASFVALTWALLAVMMFGAAVYFGVWKRLRVEIDEAYTALRQR